MRAPRPLRPAVVGDTDPFQPSRARPVRVRARSMAADTHFEPHRHAWAQLAYCATGIVQVTAAVGESGEEVTYIVPPSRAVWIAPGARHSVHVLEDAEFRTLYIHASATPPGWAGCRVLVVSPLLRELVQALDQPGLPRAREQLLTGLVRDELQRAATQDLGVPLPDPARGDKRLRALCEAVLRAPSERATLAQWAADVGASERTLARLFRDELGTTYQQWRQQAVLAHALPLLARGVPVSEVAAATGYASDSAFTAMFKSAMGVPPRGLRSRA
jgi:AraC-like DNA-binding protein/quercetin dioxygenase-like cupin family protein